MINYISSHQLLVIEFQYLHIDEEVSISKYVGVHSILYVNLVSEMSTSTKTRCALVNFLFKHHLKNILRALKWNSAGLNGIGFI